MSKLINCFPEWLTSGIFTRLGTLFPDELPWANEKGQTLDVMYFGNHSGDKETSPLLDKFIEQNEENATPEVLTEEQITTLANILYTRYGVTWDKLYKVLSAEYDPIENYSMVEEETPDITRTETPNITRDKTTSAKSDFTVTTDSGTTSDIYGFNSNSPVPQGESSGNSSVTTKGDADKNVTTESESETGTRTETETGKRTLTRSGNIGVTTSQQMLESEIKLWEWNFYETVFKNVDTVLTVPKYNFYYRRFFTMIKGGYKIIDFKDVPFETGGATMMIEGIYDTIEASYRKPLLLSGLNIDGKEYNDVYATPTVSGTNYVFTAYGKTITIQDTDAVTVSNETNNTDNESGGSGDNEPGDNEPGDDVPGDNEPGDDVPGATN